jgi:hypothetical protein
MVVPINPVLGLLEGMRASTALRQSTIGLEPRHYTLAILYVETIKSRRISRAMRHMMVSNYH